MTLPGVAHVLHLTQTESTQTLARTLAEEGAADRTLIWADYQTTGRGRLERTWDSQLGGLYISLILRPQIPPSHLPQFNLEVAAAIAKSLRSLARIETTIKPPNDVFARVGRRPLRKISGILTEASGNSQHLDWLVLGVGINVNNQPRLAHATSLQKLTGRPWPIETVLEEFLTVFSLLSIV